MGRFRDRYVVACNRPECDDNWDNSDPVWLGKASMSKRHRMLTTKDLSWEGFNVLTFGVVSGIAEAIRRLEEMREAALSWVAASPRDDGWPQAERVGLFLNVYTHSSVNSLHLHILDMDYLGPTLEKLSHKNLPIVDAIDVMKTELEEHSLMNAERSDDSDVELERCTVSRTLRELQRTFCIDGA